jgi:hypothetical protein
MERASMYSQHHLYILSVKNTLPRRIHEKRRKKRPVAWGHYAREKGSINIIVVVRAKDAQEKKRRPVTAEKPARACARFVYSYQTCLEW